MITKTINKKDVPQNIVYDLTAKSPQLKELVADIQSNFANKTIQIIVSKK
jgi:hypothetical protein